MKLIWITSSSSSSWHKFFAQFLYLTIPACTFFHTELWWKLRFTDKVNKNHIPDFSYWGIIEKKKTKNCHHLHDHLYRQQRQLSYSSHISPLYSCLLISRSFFCKKNSHICYFYPKDPTSMTDIQTENMTGHLNVASISSRADVPTDLSFRKISLFSLTCWLSAAGEVMGNFLLRWIIPVAPWNRPALACPDGCRNQKSEGLEAFLTVWLLTMCAFS